MKNPKKPAYKYCFVPECKNTIISAPDKIFFTVPIGAKIRKQWCKIIGRSEVSPRTYLHCCEDHFNVWHILLPGMNLIKKDTANYVQYNIMKLEGVKVTLRLNKGVLPHIFYCQNQNVPPPPIKMVAIKRERLDSLEEDLAEPPAKRSDVVPPQTSNNKSGSKSSHIEDSNSLANDTKIYIDKAVQVNIKTKRRSKGVYVNFTTNLKNKAVSPFKCPDSLKNTATSPLKSTSTLVYKKELFADNPDGMSSLCKVKSEPNCFPESSCMQNDDLDNEKLYKSVCVIM